MFILLEKHELLISSLGLVFVSLDGIFKLARRAMKTKGPDKVASVTVVHTTNYRH